MTKPFNLQYYLEHPETKLVTRDGRNVRILCTDLGNKDYPIAAVCMRLYRQEDEVETFTTKGRVFATPGREHGRDLFFDLPDSEKKKVPLTYEDLLERVKQGKTMWISGHPDSYMKHIIGFNKNNIDMLYVINHPSVEKFPYQELMACSFIDGDPCWKEVEK